MSFNLGAVPESLSVTLSSGADFNTTLTNADGDWSDTAVIELRFGRDADTPLATWQATITGPDAVFNEDKSDVETVIELKDRTARLWYIDGDLDLCWATGQRVTR